MATLLQQLPMTNQRIGMLRSDFSGMEKLEQVIQAVLEKLNSSSEVKTGIQMLHNNAWSLQSFDGWFEPMVRAELGKVLAIMRAKAVNAASSRGAGSASSAVLRRMYKDRIGGNVNIAQPNRRMSSKLRTVEPPTGGESGIRRARSVKQRTQQIREYFGPDRGFILRMLENGRDVFMATPEGATGRGSRATYGKRGSVGSRSFFHALGSDMEQAAQQLGQTLVDNVEAWLEQNFHEQTAK